MISAKDLICKFQQALSEGWGYIFGTAGILWTAAKQKAATREMTVKYGSQWIGKTVADCSGLFSWAFKQLGGYMYHGSNTMWNRYCTAQGELKNGQRADGQPLKPGTAVFQKSKKNGTVNRSHVGLYVGNGKVIEAHGTKAGVITSNVSEWAEWGELKGVTYDGAEPEPIDPDVKPVLRKGDSGSYVTLAQTELIQKGYSCGSKGADGIFGRNTYTAVKRFQQDSGLTVDGVIGQKTWAALDSQQPTVKWTVHIPNLSESEADELLKKYPGSWKEVN